MSTETILYCQNFTSSQSDPKLVENLSYFDIKIANQSRQSRSNQKQSGQTFNIKFFIVASILLTGVGLTILFAVYFNQKPSVFIQTLNHRILPVQNTNQIIKIQAVEINQKRLFMENVLTRVVVTQALEKSSEVQPTRLLQSNQDLDALDVTYYNIHSILQGTGIQLTFDPDGNFSPKVDPEIFQQYIIKKYPVQSYLEQVSMESNYTIENFTIQMNEIFSQAFSFEKTFNFTAVETLDLKLNNQSNKFQVKETSKPEGRRLFIKASLLWLRKNRKSIIKDIKSVVLPVFNIVRTYGPQIGCFIGGVYTMKMVGCRVGRYVGLAARFLLNTCIPIDELEIRCSARDIASAVKIQL